ncbi:MAG: 5'/3'-nucleotidase SurE [Actinomycetes bacterium]
MKRLMCALGVILLGQLGLVACSSDSDTATSVAPVTEAPTTEVPVTEAPTTTSAPEPLRILVTNDDGVGADGIDVMVQSLLAMNNVTVTVVAPLENQSGTGGKTTVGDLAVTDATTKSGYPAKAVAGFPADTIIWAIDQGGIDFVPDLVVSGINNGQNYGLEIVPLSGTVGAARAAAVHDIPSVAVSQGLAAAPDFPTSAAAVVKWIEDHRDELLARADGETVTEFANVNAPSCAAGLVVRGVIETPIESMGTSDYNANDCASTVVPTGDVSGFQNGYITISMLPISGSPFTD